MRSIFVLLFLTLFFTSSATHIRGGEFRYSHLSGSTYAIEFHFYTYLNSPADRPELVIDMGDGTVDTVPRTSIEDLPFGANCSGVRFATYATDHTFPGFGTYTISLLDPNRNGGILNIPNSNAEAFCVSATLVVSPNVAGNNSVIFENRQYVIEQDGWDLLHMLDPIDIDGDSLSFEAVVPKGTDCLPISGYSFPGPQFSVDPIDGHWELTAAAMGEYVIAVTATEWRNGEMIGQVTRDMSVCVFSTDVQEISSDQLLSVSPAITEGPVRITLHGSIAHALTIIDASGRLIHSTSVRPGDQWLDLSDLKEGIYLLTIEDVNGGNFTTRIVKQ